LYAGSQNGKVYFSDNLGFSWTNIGFATTGVGQVRDIMFKDSTMLATTHSLVYFSNNNGLDWDSIDGTGMDVNNLYCTTISGNNLFAGTSQKGAFVNSSILLSLNKLDWDNSQITLFPNPVSKGDVFFTLSSNVDFVGATICIYNTLGQVMHTETISGISKKVISLKDVLPGVYFVTVVENGRSNTRKLVAN